MADVHQPAAVVQRHAGTTDGLVRFRNGDTLHGILQRIDANQQIEWRHPESKEPLRFSTTNVMQIALPTTGREEPWTANVMLTNGDRLRGTLLTLDAESLTLQTWYAGPLKLKRAMLRQLAVTPGGEALVFDGFGSDADWRHGGNPDAWQFRNGSMVGTQFGSLGRDVGLPDRCSVEFDFSWTQMPLMQVGLFGKQAEAILSDGNATGYWFGFHGGHLLLTRATGTESSALGSIDISRLLRNGKIHVTLQADKSKKTLTARIDDGAVKTWSEPGEWAGQGRCLTFVGPQNNVGSTRLSNLLVREWAGQADSGGALAGGSTDVICLANEDRLSGTVKSLKNGVFTVEATGTNLSVPLERITTIHFGKIGRAHV